MQSTYETHAEFAADVVRESRGAWLNGTFTVAGIEVGIKAYGKTVQRMQWRAFRDGGNFKTQKAMHDFIECCLRIT